MKISSGFLAAPEICHECHAGGEAADLAILWQSCPMEPIPRFFGKKFGDYRDETSTQGGGSSHRKSRQQEPIAELGIVGSLV